MYTLTITLSGGKLPRLTQAEIRGVAKDAALMSAAEVKRNFTRLATASGSRRFWHHAAAKTQVEEQPAGDSFYISVRHRGVRLQWRGGKVLPTGRPSAVTGRPTRSLLIPFEDSPLRLRDCTLAEMHLPEESLHVITSRHGTPILVHTEKLKTKYKLTYLGKLVKSTTHRPHPEVLPPPETMRAAAIAGAQKSLTPLLKQKS